MILLLLVLTAPTIIILLVLLDTGRRIMIKCSPTYCIGMGSFLGFLFAFVAVTVMAMQKEVLSRFLYYTELTDKKLMCNVKAGIHKNYKCVKT